MNRSLCSNRRWLLPPQAGRVDGGLGQRPAAPQPHPRQRVAPSAAVAGGAVAVGGGDRAEQPEVVEVQDSLRARRAGGGQRAPAEHRVQVVGVDHFGSQQPGRAGDLVGVEPAAQHCPRGASASGIPARALEHLDDVPPAVEQTRNVANRPLLAAEQAVAVVDQQDAHGQQTGMLRLMLVSRPCSTASAKRSQGGDSANVHGDGDRAADDLPDRVPDAAVSAARRRARRRGALLRRRRALRAGVVPRPRPAAGRRAVPRAAPARGGRGVRGRAPRTTR